MNNPLPTPLERWEQLTDIEVFNPNYVCKVFGDYKKFVQAEPKLGDFVACGEDGKPIEKPFEYDNFRQADKALKSHQKWNQAVERVKFQGWKIETTEMDLVQLTNGMRNLTIEHEGKHHFLPEYKTINAIITAGIPLVPTDNLKNELEL